MHENDTLHIATIRQELRKVLEAFADLGLDHLLRHPEDHVCSVSCVGESAMLMMAPRSKAQELKRFLSSAKELREMLEANSCQG